MTKKKISSSKKSESQKVAKVAKKKDENLGKAELDIIQKSFEMVKRLKEEVQNIKTSKDEIKASVQKIEDKVAKHESLKQSASSDVHNTILHNLKEEIAKDFAPILKKFNLKEAKEEIFKEISKVIELESSKLKSEVDSLNSKNKKEFTKKLSDLEVKILYSLNENEKIKEKLKTNSTQISFSKEIEERMHDIVARANEKYFTMLDANTLELEELQKHSKLIEKKVDTLKSKVREGLSQEGVSLSSIESKIIKLEEENKSIKSLIERYENELYSRTKNETSVIENKVKAILDDATIKLAELEKNNKFQEKFVVSKINEVITYVKVVEKKLNQLEQQDMSKVEKIILKSLSDKSQELELSIKEFLTSTKKELWTDYKQFAALKEEILPLYEDFKKDFKIFEISKEQVAKQLRKDIEKEMNALSIIAQKNTDLTKTTIKELDTNIKDFEKKFQIQTQKQVEDFKDRLGQEVRTSIMDVMSEMKRNKDVTFADIDLHRKDTFERIENKFQDINKKYTTQFEELSKLLLSTSGETKKIEKLFKLEKDAQQKFLVNKYNSIVDELNTRNVEQIDAVKKETTKDFNKIVESKVFELLGDFKKEKDMLSKEFVSYRKGIEQLYAKSLKELDNKINTIKDEKVQINNFLEESKSQIASQIASSNEYLTKINLENKEDKRQLKEEIESRFLTAKTQYDSIFNSHLESFEQTLMVKEEEYLSKLNVIEADKNEMVKELVEFKTEITTLTKDYVAKLDEEFQKIKVLEANFESEKDSFTMQIGEIYEQRKQGLKAHSEILEEKLTHQIISQKETFDENENTFRELFKEKIHNLHEVLDKRIDKLQNNFVEKNLKSVTERLNAEMEIFKLYEERLISKEEELSKKQDILNDQHDSFGADLEATTEFLNAKVEERLITLEKQFNKRFLDYDTSFSTFKGVIIDEIEDFMKEIEAVTNERVKKVESIITKLNFTHSEMEKSLAHFHSVEQSYEIDITNLREEVADTSAKLHLLNDVSTYGLNDHVQYMSEYEKQLTGLIKNLKIKGISNANIRAALINKGHPSFYVTMIVNNFDEIYN